MRLRNLASTLAALALAAPLLAGTPTPPPANDLPAGPPPYTPPTPDTTARVNVAELQKLIADKAVVIVDVRDPGSFAQGHIPYAINLPLYELQPRIKEVKDRTRKVVTYCACPDENTSARAAEQFRSAGHDSAALRGGWHAWLEATGTLELSPGAPQQPVPPAPAP